MTALAYAEAPTVPAPRRADGAGVHVDVLVADLDAAHDRVVALGAAYEA